MLVAREAIHGAPRLIEEYNEPPVPFRRWPTNDDASVAFLTILELIGSGVNGVAECLRISDQIDPDSKESWEASWRMHAVHRKEKALTAESSRHYATAESNWWIAACYFLAAQMLMELADDRREALLAEVRECTTAVHGGRRKCGTVRLQDETFGELRASSYGDAHGRGAAPAVIAFGGRSELKEEIFLRLRTVAARRGIWLLVVELPEAGRTEFARSDIYLASMVIDRWLSYLLSGENHGTGKIGVLGLDLGGKYASHFIGDDRVGAVVCDGLRARRMRSASNLAVLTAGSSLRPPLTEWPVFPSCPVLTSFDDDRWPGALQLHCMGSDESAPEICRETLLPSDAYEAIFDWLADSLETPLFNLDADSKLGS